MDINCPDLKVGAIDKLAFTGLLPQASLRGAQNQPVFRLTSIFQPSIEKKPNSVFWQS
jgi:hypothetical protein